VTGVISILATFVDENHSCGRGAKAPARATSHTDQISPVETMGRGTTFSRAVSPPGKGLQPLGLEHLYRNQNLRG
jgi:hypothetical protein